MLRMCESHIGSIEHGEYEQYCTIIQYKCKCYVCSVTYVRIRIAYRFGSTDRIALSSPDDAQDFDALLNQSDSTGTV